MSDRHVEVWASASACYNMKKPVALSLLGFVAAMLVTGINFVITGSYARPRSFSSPVVITNSLGVRIMGAGFLLFAICVGWYLLYEFRGKKMKAWEIDVIIVLVVLACMCGIGGIFFAVVN